MWTMKPVSPAHWRCWGSMLGDVKDSIVVRSLRSHVFPIENEPLAFSFDLCMRTLPDFRTETIMTRGFSESRRCSGGGGLVGCDPYSVIRICVMYVSMTVVGRRTEDESAQSCLYLCYAWEHMEGDKR